MRKIPAALTFLLLMSQASWSQTPEKKGYPISEIFTNFHYSINDTSETTGFGIERALLGYTLPAGENFSATVIVNISSPEEVVAGTKTRRFAHFREAFISYSKDKLTLNFGITKTLLADYQQRFLEKRYIAENLIATREFGYVSDLGVSAWYRFSDLIRADVSLMNGKGYSTIQFDNNLKTSAGIYITPGNLAFRIFGDIMKRETDWQSTMVGFAGFKNDLLTIGAEMSYKKNLGMREGSDAWGFSGTGAVYISDKVDIFARYDWFSSAFVNDDPYRWNYLDDGRLAIGGIEYSFSKKIKISLNYQGTYAYDNRDAAELIYLNSLFRF